MTDPENRRGYPKTGSFQLQFGGIRWQWPMKTINRGGDFSFAD
jgi:hypothetical protein